MGRNRLHLAIDDVTEESWEDIARGVVVDGTDGVATQCADSCGGSGACVDCDDPRGPGN
jgi:hypothetical protein